MHSNHSLPRPQIWVGGHGRAHCINRLNHITDEGTVLMSAPRMQVTRSEDGEKAVLSFLESSGMSGSIELDTEQLLQLIASLGYARSSLLEKQPIPSMEGTRVTPVYNTHWALQIDTLTEGSTLAFQHPAYGAVGLVFTPDDVEKLIQGLQKHRTIIHSAPDASQKPS